MTYTKKILVFFDKLLTIVVDSFGRTAVRVLSILIDKMRLWRYELTYKLHLKVRKYHDVLVIKSPSYRKVTESKYALPVKNATISAFFVSLMLFTTIQYILPQFNLFTPGKAYAGADSVTWSSNGDFANNRAGKVKSNNNALCAGTTQSNITISGGVYDPASNCASAGVDSSIGLTSGNYPKQGSFPNAPVTVAGGGALVSVGNYIYAFTGNSTTNFYRFSPTENSWSAMAVSPIAVGNGGSLAYPGSGDYIYAVVGGLTTGFYRYSISGNSWTTMSSFVYGMAQGASLVASGDYVYALQGLASTRFRRYTISSDSWSDLASTPDWINWGGSMVYPGNGDFIYVLRGDSTQAFYRYSISANSWSSMSVIPSNVGDGGALVSRGDDYIYAYRGNAFLFYRYSISSNTWTGMTNSPAVIAGGGALTYPGSGDFVYGFRGNTTNSFYRYSIPNNNWVTTLAPTSVNLNNGQGLVHPDGDFIYAFFDSTAFYRYSISNNVWTSMALAPAARTRPGALVWDGNNYIYAMQGYNGTGFWRYSISGNSWSTMAVYPVTPGEGGSLGYIGTGDYIYSTAGSSNGFYRYSISGNSWTQMTNLPLSSVTGNLVYPGSGDYLYYNGGIYGGTNMLRYSISGNSWASLAAYPNITYESARMVYPGSGDYMYLTRGGNGLVNYNTFWRYSISGNSFSVMANTPVNYFFPVSMVSGGNGNIYTFMNTGNTNFYAYNIAGNWWTNFFGPSVAPTGSVSGLKMDAGAGSKYSWSNITWNTDTLPANTSVTLRARTSEDNISWSDPGWTQPGYTQITGNTGSGDISSLQNSRYLDIQVVLNSANGLGTPYFNDITVSYNFLDTPAAQEAKKLDGTVITSDGYTSESSIIEEYSAQGFTAGETLYPEIEVVSQAGSYTGTGVVGSGVTLGSDNETVELSVTKNGLSPGNYKFKIRTSDSAGRVSAWSSNEGLFRIEQEAPTGSITLSGSNIVNGFAKSTAVEITPTASDTGGSSIAWMHFSNTGTGWGATTNTDGTLADGTAGTCTSPNTWDGTSCWAPYSGIQRSWNLLPDDGPKNVYAQYRDNAGNVSGETVHTTTAQFVSPPAGITNTGDELKLTSVSQSGLPITVDCSDSPNFQYSSILQNLGADETRVQWTWNAMAGYDEAGLLVNGSLVSNHGEYLDSQYSGAETYGWAAGSTVQLRCKDPNYEGGTLVSGTVDFRSSALPIVVTYVSSPIQNPGIFTTVDWSDKTTSPNSGDVKLKVTGGDSIGMLNPITSGLLSKGDLVPVDIRSKAYLKYEVVMWSGNSRTETPIVYDVTIGSAPVASTTLDSTPPENVSNLKAYTTSGGTEMPDSSWQAAGNPYFQWSANVSDTTGYRYCFGNSGCSPTVENNNNTSITLNLSNQATYPDGTYYFKVVAYDGAENISVTPTVYTYKLDRTTPGAVTGFTASQNQLDQIDLAWSTISDPNGSPITYTIERIRYSKYLEGFAVNDILPSKVWADQTSFGYAIFTGVVGGNYTDTIALENQGLKYVYRIKASDESGKVGPYQNAPVYGLTRDGVNPTTPSNVVTVACSYQAPANCSDQNDDALKGHEVTLTWTKGTDDGTGIDTYLIYRANAYSIIEGDYSLVGTVTVPNPLPGGYNLTYTDSTGIVDYTHYYYRVVARDTSTPPNRSSFIPTSDENYASIWTPDVTAPTTPVVTASAGGLDSSNEHQKTVITWAASTDTGIGVKTYQLYRAIQAVPDATDRGNLLTDNDFTEVTSGPGVSCDLVARICYEEGLSDFRYYYYRVKAIDGDPYNNVSAFSATSPVKTLSSAVPTPPRGRIDPETRAVEPYPYVLTTKGNPNTDANVGDEARIYFSGSYEKDCTGGVTAPCLVRYDIYRSTDRNTWTKLGEQLPIRTDNDRDNEYTFVSSGLNDASKYYYQVRAVGNNPDVVLGGVTSSSIGASNNEGWDITPDATKPTIPAGGLEVKVRDTHPNEVELRNIITWKVLTSSTVSKRNGASDFSKYIVRRETYNPDTDTLITDDTVEEITDISLNYYMDVIQIAFANLKYKYYIQIEDNAGTEYKYDNGSIINTFSNLSSKEYSGDSIIPSKAKPILTAPITLSNISVASAEVSWTTDQDADSIVQFRPTGSTGEWMIDGKVERTMTHNVKLVGLSPNTQYEYEVISRNYLGNNIQDIGTLPPLSTSGFNITPAKVTTTTSTAEINWTTNLDASSAFIEYQMQRQGNDEPQSGTAGVSVESLAATPRNHKVVIKGLRSGKTYNYIIKSISKDNYLAAYPTQEDNNKTVETFTTRNFDSAQFSLAPSSSNVADRNITSTTAQIVWQTGSPTTSWVDYGTVSGVYGISSGDDNLVTTHVVTLEGLVPGTKYFYHVRVKDVNEVEFTSQEYSFVAVLKPKISNMTVKDVTPYSVTIAWDTNVDTETIINWGTTTAYGEKRGISGVSKVHQIKVDNLLDNQEYHYQILAKDDTGNEVADTDKIVRTPLDTEGPKITNAKIDILPMGDNDTTSSAIVSWNTNKPATTMVEYDEGIIGGSYTNQSTEDPSLNTTHTVIIKGLKPATSYHYRMVSADKRQNVTQSQDYTFVTPTKEKSILQLILKSLEDTFSWTRNLGQFFTNIGRRLTGGN